MQKNNQLIHFIGIGGIGVSGLAFIYLKQGHSVQGSDLEKSAITQELAKQGARVFIGQHQKSNIKNQISKIQIKNKKYPDLVIYSEAVPDDNPELQDAKKLGIKCLSGAEALGEFSENYFLIAVSGMHGKTTTASMIAQIMIAAGQNPTFIIGTKPGWRLGKSKYLIIEADDYKAKFLNYHPNILVLTNIEEEHLDYFKNLDHILEVFQQYLKQVQNLIIYNKQDKNILKIINAAKCRVKPYALQNIDIGVPGIHNQHNAVAALTLANALNIDNKITLQALKQYHGVWRRFEEHELKIKNFKLKIIHDYAHHPTEIKAVLQAACEKYKNKKIIAVFQPHQYQRTRILFNDFTKSFDRADQVIITDIYSVAGREKNMTPTGQDLSKATANSKYIPLKKLAEYIKKIAQPNQVILIMGAGDVYNIKF